MSTIFFISEDFFSNYHPLYFYNLPAQVEIFEEFPHVKKRYWGRHFWARGYFCVTSGELTKDMIQEYLEHHFEKDPDDKFDIE